jgi:hypothetical protein
MTIKLGGKEPFIRPKASVLKLFLMPKKVHFFLASKKSTERLFFAKPTILCSVLMKKIEKKVVSVEKNSKLVYNVDALKMYIEVKK